MKNLTIALFGIAFKQRHYNSGSLLREQILAAIMMWLDISQFGQNHCY
jgi:hypothetical protein